MFSTVMSAFFSKSLTRASPRGDLRSSVSDFLLALNMWKYHGSSGAFPGSTRRAGSPVFGFSILTTSAPSQASASVHEGPASNWVKSTTRMPARNCSSWLLSLITDLSFRLVSEYSPPPRRPRWPEYRQTPRLAIGVACVGVRSSGPAVAPGSNRRLTFGGDKSTTIAAGAFVVSDPVDLAV